MLAAVDKQTSFMHPPFGFALFYLRNVAPQDDYTDRVTRKPVAGVTTTQIYWGALPFVLVQIIMVGLIIAFPNLVSRGLAKKGPVDTHDVVIEIQPQEADTREMDASKLFGVEPAASAASN